MEKWKSSSQKKKVVPLHKLVREHFSPSNYGLICLNPTVHLLTQGISKLWFQTGTIFPQYQEITQGWSTGFNPGCHKPTVWLGMVEIRSGSASDTETASL